MKLLSPFSAPATTAGLPRPGYSVPPSSSPRVTCTTPPDPAWAVYHSVASTLLVSAARFRTTGLSTNVVFGIS